MKSAGRIRKLDRILEISQIVQCNLQIGQIGRLDGTYTASHKKEFWQGSGHSYLVYSDLIGCANGSRYQNTAKSGVLQVKAWSRAWLEYYLERWPKYRLSFLAKYF